MSKRDFREQARRRGRKPLSGLQTANPTYLLSSDQLSPPRGDPLVARAFFGGLRLCSEAFILRKISAEVFETIHDFFIIEAGLPRHPAKLRTVKLPKEAGSSTHRQPAISGRCAFSIKGPWPRRATAKLIGHLQMPAVIYVVEARDLEGRVISVDRFAHLRIREVRRLARSRLCSCATVQLRGSDGRVERFAGDQSGVVRRRAFNSVD
ncbi:hypothetical protein ACO2Q0_20835 [Phenylobacterium sp. VNQ135]|uniref:hypothetical protein n=1 Tax=Phenylobacterium sp. VNQ135 TaxID=3400922 RepID=UPI003BFBAAD3